MGECLELNRFTDLKNLKEECGDLLCSTIQLANECEWDISELINATCNKIKKKQFQYKSLGRKIKVCILGGAFNPIHNGHINASKFILNTSKTFDEVWLMPCYNHSDGKRMETPHHRLEMCKLAVQKDGRIKVSDYEIKNKLKGETYHLAKRILEEDWAKNKYDLSIAIGQDNANSFEDWVNYRHLEKMIRFVVLTRKGVEIPSGSVWYLNPPHIYLNDENDLTNISSTKVRELFNLGKENELKFFLDEKVFNYIGSSVGRCIWTIT